MSDNHAIELADMTLDQFERWQTIDKAFLALRAAHDSGTPEEVLAASAEGARAAFAFRKVYRKNED